MRAKQSCGQEGACRGNRGPKGFWRKGLGARSAALIFPPRQTPDFHPIFACLILRQISLGSPAQFFRASPLLICGISQAFLTRVGRARRRAFFVSPIFEDAFRSFQWERITATKWKNCGKLRILKRIAGVRFVAGVNCCKGENWKCSPGGADFMRSIFPLSEIGFQCRCRLVRRTASERKFRLQTQLFAPRIHIAQRRHVWRKILRRFWLAGHAGHARLRGMRGVAI